MERKPEDEEILEKLKKFRKKTSGIEKDAIEYKISQLESRINYQNDTDIFQSKISVRRLQAKIVREENHKKGLIKLMEIDQKNEDILRTKSEFIDKKIYFLKKELKNAFESDDDVQYVKTTGNIKFNIISISINPIFKCNKIELFVDSESKAAFKPEFRGEINIPIVNAKEFELIAFGENDILINLIFFPCEYLIHHNTFKKEILDLQEGTITLQVMFEREAKLVRRNAERVCVVQFGHSLETYRSLTPFLCCVCNQFISILSSAFRCFKCKFTSHKQCANYILFQCPCTSQLKEKFVKRYNIPHTLNPSISTGMKWCGHCGSRITTGAQYLKCKKCSCGFHLDCSGRVFYACGLTFELRCVMADFNPPNPEISDAGHATNIEDFSLVKVLGRGSYGKVMLAKHKKDNLIVALKILKKESLVDANEITCIELERKVLQFATTSNHPFLMKMIYCFQDSKYIFFGTEFLAGGDLFHHAAIGVFSQPRIKLYAAEILVGLEFLHQNNIIYRDMKLENIMLASDGHLKIVDYGLSKDNFGPFAVTYTYCGTPDTIAPEVILQVGYSKEADWWSYGIVLYEMFEDEPPFNGATPGEMAIGIINNEVTYNKTPAVAQDLISKLLNKDPTQRLGNGLKDGEEIRAHPYFEGIDWELIMKKCYTPPFIPEKGLDANFDPEFIDEPIHLTPVSSFRQYDRFFTNFK